MKISNNRRVWMGAMLAGAVLGAGCVTINIYFPAAIHGPWMHYNGIWFGVA